jgi:hypothetical protein
LGWQEFVVVSQAAPSGLPVQSPSDMQLTQKLVDVLQTGLPGIAQSAFVTQPTQRPVDVLQARLYGSPAQSEFDVQAASHVDPWQFSPAGQSALVEQPHVVLHTLPPVDVAQSAGPVHQHTFVVVSQVAPERLAAQSALVVQLTHWPVVVLHAGANGRPAQSALLAQALMHWLRYSSSHTRPLAQSIVAEQLQTGWEWGTPGSKHSLPPAALAQSAMVEHPHACVAVSHTGPSGLVAQSALALHATQAPVETSHSVPVALPVQSESLLQRFSHRVPR